MGKKYDGAVLARRKGFETRSKCEKCINNKE